MQVGPGAPTGPRFPGFRFHSRAATGRPYIYPVLYSGGNRPFPRSREKTDQETAKFMDYLFLKPTGLCYNED